MKTASDPIAIEGPTRRPGVDLAAFGRGVGPAQSKPRWRVLVVDDSPAILTAVMSLLSLAPCVEVVGVAVTGGAALEEEARLRPDLVLMDLMMPGMGGLEAARHISGRAGAPPVVIMTAHEQPAYRDAALRSGASGFLVKSRLDAELFPLLDRLAPARKPNPTRTPAMDSPHSDPETGQARPRGKRTADRTESQGPGPRHRTAPPADPRAREGAGSSAVAPAGDPAVPAIGDETSPLCDALRLLLARLADVRDGKPRATEGAEVWGDREYLYLEVEAPGQPGLDFDLCIREGQFYARMAR